MDMKKNWICHAGTSGESNLLLQFRREFELPRGGEAVVRIHANQQYKLYLDGVLQGRGIAPSCLAHPYYDEYKLVCPAKFCLAVVVYGMGENIPLVTEQNKGPTCLNAEVCIGGKRYVTDESWRCRPDPAYFRDTMSSLDPMANRISAWGGFKEIYDTCLQDDSWMRAGYDDSLWQSAQPCGRANELYGSPSAAEAPSPVLAETLSPSVIQTDANLGRAQVQGEQVFLYAENPGSFPAAIFDFGREVVGYLTLRVRGERGSSLSLWYGESLDMLRTDTFLLNGEEQVLKPFQRKALRYMKISANGGQAPAVIGGIEFDLVHFPLEEKEKLHFEDTLLQKVYDVSLYTTKLASQYHFEDSVYREQMQWLLDSRIMSLVHYECFGETRLAEKAIRQFCRTQREDGSIRAAGPQECNQLLPDFCLHFVKMIEEFLHYSGKRADEEILQTLQKLFGWLRANENAEGMLDVDGKAGWWCFLDWAPVDKRGCVTALNCLYYGALQSYANILKGERFPFEEWSKKAQGLRGLINARMFDAQKGLYCDCFAEGKRSSSCSQQSNMYALLCDVAEQADALLDKICAEDFAGVRINGAFLMCLAVDHLLERGRIAQAKQWIDKYWGEMLRRGATSWWETFDMSTPPASVPYAYSKNNATYLHEYIPVSYCHAWGAGIAYSLARAKRAGKL